MEAIVLGFFGSYFLGNFQLGFLFGGFGVQVFWLGLGS
jgi:mannose/fructose/N-acetylgalactosamine-specific phosphotransferase system component IIC